MRLLSCWLLVALALSGCGFTHVATQCPSCPVTYAEPARPVAMKPTARTLFVLVPGILGFGWEWDKPVARLRARDDLDFVVFWWTPYVSQTKGGAEMRTVLTRLLAMAQVEKLVVVAHSVGGLIAVEGLRDLEVPFGKRLEVVTIGTPFGGMNLAPSYSMNPRGTPVILSTVGQFDSHVAPPARARVVAYVTKYPPDPVMKPWFGREPADPRWDPPGTLRVTLQGPVDHNEILDHVFVDLFQRLQKRL